MELAKKYISGLRKVYLDNNAKEAWEHFENIKCGAKREDIIKLKKIFPLIPDTLLTILEYVDGTFWREYQGEKIAFYFLGSDVEEYPYFLLSSKEIIESMNIAAEYSDYIERDYEEEGVEMDTKITKKSNEAKWLLFSNCMNNGGTSKLFIDFTPSPSGSIGQVLRYLHDPDEFKVIANSFEDYLQMLMDNEYDFINEDSIEE